jgi:hypothetical protein
VEIDGFRRDVSGGDRCLTRVVREKIIELANKPIRPVAKFPFYRGMAMSKSCDFCQIKSVCINQESIELHLRATRLKPCFFMN